MVAIAVYLTIALFVVLCWALILLSYWHPWFLTAVVGAICVGVGWAAVAYREKDR